MPTSRGLYPSGRLICSKSSLLLGCMLADGYAECNGDFREDRFEMALDRHARRLVKHARKDPFGIYGPSPHSTQDDLIDLIMVLHEKARFPFPAPPPEVVDIAAERCEKAMRSLERRGLIVDPPWLEIAGISTVVLSGIVPIDVSVKTSRGKDLVKHVSVKARLWEFERETSNERSEWHFKLKIGQFIGKALAQFAQRYLQQWNQSKRNREEAGLPPADVGLDSDQE